MKTTRTLRVGGEDAYELDLGDGRKVRLTGKTIDESRHDIPRLLLILQQLIDESK